MKKKKKKAYDERHYTYYAVERGSQALLCRPSGKVERWDGEVAVWRSGRPKQQKKPCSIWTQLLTLLHFAF